MLAADIDVFCGEALAMNRKAIDYNVIQRDVESSTQIYQALLQRANETGVSGELRTSNVRVVDTAETPASPVSPLSRSEGPTALLLTTFAVLLGVSVLFSRAASLPSSTYASISSA